MSFLLSLDFDAATLKNLAFGLSLTRAVGTAAGAIGTLALYLLLLVPQGQTSLFDSLYEEGILVIVLGGLTLVSLLGLPGDIFYLWALATNQDVTSESLSTASSIFSTISVVFLALTAFGFVGSSLSFLVSGGFFVLLYFVAAEALFLIPTGLQYAAATFFSEYARVTSSVAV